MAISSARIALSLYLLIHENCIQDALSDLSTNLAVGSNFEDLHYCTYRN
jgi:hypothetical protein